MIHLLALAVLFVQGTLDELLIEIIVDADAAAITANYSFAQSPGPVVFTAIRIDGQTLTVEAVEGVQAVPQVSTRKGAYRIAATGNASDELRIRYRVSGDLRRIPLFVPDKPTEQGRSRIGIRIAGVDGEGALQGTFPRMSRDPSGELVARPVNVPGFLILPSSGNSITSNRLADIAVLVLILLATAIWIWTHRIARTRA